MKTILTYLYTFSIVALVCGILMHMIFHTITVKYETERANDLRKASQSADKYSEQKTGLELGQVRLVRVTFFCGNICVGVGMLLTLLWFCLGGRSGIWIPFLLLLIDIPFWAF